MAISLAKNEDTISASDIYRRYGDHLYDDKGDYERAIEQYIHTIGSVAPVAPLGFCAVAIRRAV